uniref:HNH endonuclease n=1 Tax=Marseillevirus LCMAC101 TaxID=2506602 RepID=A0A481YS02_9VIRU|nr:MAG: HNH endonuclease [Marseillevirus LCMAC101]
MDEWRKKNRRRYNEYHKRYRKNIKKRERENIAGVVLPDFPGYIITKDGQVYSKYFNRFLTLNQKSKGYLKLKLVEIKNSVKTHVCISIHRLVALAYIPNLENLPIVNHKDGDKLNNRSDNLEWVTRKRNAEHAYETGLHKILKTEILQYSLDGDFIKTYESTANAAESLNCCRNSVQAACSGRNKTCKGFILKYADPPIIREIKTSLEGEKWKRIEDSEYEISTMGRIYSHKTDKFMKICLDFDGYSKTSLNNKDKQRHRLVAEAFLDKIEGKPVVNHKNGAKSDNTLENLEWCTQKENIQHAVDTGLTKCTTAVVQYTLDGKFVKEWSKIKDAAKEVDVNGNSILKACQGLSNTSGEYQWRFKGDELPGKTSLRFKRICQYDKSGKFIKKWDKIIDASRELDIDSWSNISAACKGKVKTAGGYQWRYDGDDPPQPLVRKTNGKKINQIDKEGAIIKTWPSLLEASENLGIHSSGIHMACNGKIKTSGGYRWEYDQ